MIEAIKGYELQAIRLDVIRGRSIPAEQVEQLLAIIEQDSEMIRTALLNLDSMRKVRKLDLSSLGTLKRIQDIFGLTESDAEDLRCEFGLS